MSIWATDLGYDSTWPEWFTRYRMATDAEVHAMIAAVTHGDMSEDDFAAWAMEDADRHVRWLESLSPDRRAWIDAQEAADRTIALSAARRDDRVAWPGPGLRTVH